MPTLRDWFRDPYIGLGSSPGAPPEATIGQAMAPYAQDLLRLGEAFGLHVPGVTPLPDWIDPETGGARLSQLDPGVALQVMGQPGLVGIRPERAALARQVIRRGQQVPYFHGSVNPQRLLEEGFSLEHLGSHTKPQLGEVTGVSLTTNPTVAQSFGSPVRVVVDVPESAVGDLLDPEARQLLRQAFETATRQHPVTWAPRRTPAGQSYVVPSQAPAAAINQTMNDYLRAQGVEAIRYNPNRWDEFELRVLDPKKAIPVGEMPHPYGDTRGIRRAIADSERMIAKIKGQLESPRLVADEAVLLRRSLQQEETWLKQLQDQLVDLTGPNPRAYPAFRRWFNRNLMGFEHTLQNVRHEPATLEDILGDLRHDYMGGW